jgi:hypothetical protein
MLLIDAHVHIHDCFDLDGFFDAAYGNFRAAAEWGEAITWTGFLLLTEGEKQHRFRQLRERGSSARNWRALSTGEPHSLRLERKGRPGHGMYLVAGRQIVTAEKLEVLALLSGAMFEDGRPLAPTVAAVREAGGLPALPWGAGKWLGERKRVLASYLARQEEPELFLADNGCRPSFWPFPRYARNAGLQLLAGSDPLPFPWEERRAGSFGVRLQAEVDERFPAAGLGELLRDRRWKPQPYGRPERTFRFFRNQAAMQIHKNFLPAGLS